jgi:hypothetical protein
MIASLHKQPQQQPASQLIQNGTSPHERSLVNGCHEDGSVAPKTANSPVEHDLINRMTGLSVCLVVCVRSCVRIQPNSPKVPCMSSGDSPAAFLSPMRTVATNQTADMSQTSPSLVVDMERVAILDAGAQYAKVSLYSSIHDHIWIAGDRSACT